MQIDVTHDDDGLTWVALAGRLDIAGAGKVSIPLAAVSTQQGARVAIDMTKVEYLASIGIRELLGNARQLSRRDGRMVLMGAQDNVRQVLLTTGIDKAIPMVDDAEAARAALA